MREQPSQACDLREHPIAAHIPFIPSRRRLPLRGRSILRLRRAPSSRGCSAVMQKRGIREYRFPAPQPSPRGEDGEHSEPDRVLGKRERTPVSSLRFTRVPERRSHPLSSLPVEDCPCGADLSSAFGAPLLQGAAQRSCKNAVYENTASPHHSLPRMGKVASVASRIGF